MDTEDCDSVVAQSSSGIDDGDVAIICPDQKFKHKIQKRLEEKRYKVVDCLKGEWTKLNNILSETKHDCVRVVIFQNHNFKVIQDQLLPLVGKSHLPLGSTLILHDSSVLCEDIDSGLRMLPMITLANKMENIIQQICLYVEASVEADHRNITDAKERCKLYALLLIGPFVNNAIPYSELSKRFHQNHGTFRSLQVGKLKRFLQKNPMVCMVDSKDPEVSVTREGKCLIQSCTERVARSFDLRDPNLCGRPLESESSTVDSVCTSSLEHQRCPSPVRTVDKLISSPKRNDAECSTKQKSFFEQLHDFQPGYAYFLVTSAMDYFKKLEVISKLPILKVFDFDPHSRARGLLNSVEEAVKAERNFTITTLDESEPGISDNSTHWVFMKGLGELDANAAEGKLKWEHTYTTYLNDMCDELVQYCVLQKHAVFLVWWYEEIGTKFLKCILMYIRRAFSTSNDLPWDIVLCIPKVPSANSKLKNVIDVFKIKNFLVVDQTTLVDWLEARPTPVKKQHGICRLPRINPEDEEGLDEIDVPKSTLAWINDVFEILSISEDVEENQNSHSEKSSKRIGEEFARGGVLKWSDIKCSNAPAEREVHRKLCEFIKKKIEQCTSIVLSITHSPGGGGTTFGRQVLWSLRTLAPCCALLPCTYFPLPKILESIKELHKHTQLPVILLVDGESDADVLKLFHFRPNAVVILHIQRRFTGSEKSEVKVNGDCHLAGQVTLKEAEDLRTFFSVYSSQHTRALMHLEDEVAIGTPHEVYEFGLTAFSHEFKGVESYVRGYMGEKQHNLSWWHTIIAYLSLLKYYGQSGMYCEVFRKLIPDCNEFPSISQFKAPCWRFVIEEADFWKINHNAVAKRVLEYVLYGHTHISDPRLSEPAKSNLCRLVLKFIDHVKSVLGNCYVDKVVIVLQRAILKRDHKESATGDEIKKKFRYSLLLDDLTEDDRVKVLEKCTTEFPMNAEFHANHGRLLGHVKRFEDSKQSFNKALELARKTRQSNELSFRNREALSRYNNMFGYMYHGLMKTFDDHLENALKEADNGIKRFKESRRYATDNGLHSIMGELKVRLEIVKMFLETYHNINRAVKMDVDRNHLGVCQFVKVSQIICSHLLDECKCFSRPGELKNHDYDAQLAIYQNFYKDFQIPSNQKDEHTDIFFNRSKIATIKLKYESQDRSTKEDIEKVVRSYENIFREAFSGSEVGSISVDMQNWLLDIRHTLIPDRYELTEVLGKLEQWEDRKEFGLSTFYLFVVRFLLAIFTTKKKRKDHWEKKTKLFQKISQEKKHLSIRREVLADHDGLTIRKIISSGDLGKWDHEQKTWSTGIEKLQVCTGTITKSEWMSNGIILMDVSDQTEACKIEIFFQPKKYDLYGKRHALLKKRVEFFLEFNTRNGAIAESVKPLQKRTCRECSIRTEIITLNQPGIGKCIKCQKAFD